MTQSEKDGWDNAWRVARSAIRVWGGKSGMGKELAIAALAKMAESKARTEKTAKAAKVLRAKKAKAS